MWHRSIALNDAILSVPDLELAQGWEACLSPCWGGNSGEKLSWREHTWSDSLGNKEWMALQAEGTACAKSWGYEAIWWVQAKYKLLGINTVQEGANNEASAWQAQKILTGQRWNKSRFGTKVGSLPEQSRGGEGWLPESACVPKTPTLAPYPQPCPSSKYFIKCILVYFL